MEHMAWAVCDFVVAYVEAALVHVFNDIKQLVLEGWAYQRLLTALERIKVQY